MSKPARHDLLVEIGTEELPAAAQRPLADALADGLGRALTDRRLEPGSIKAYSTPRRIAVVAQAVPGMEPDRVHERKGPNLKAAFDAGGQPTRAAEGFAKSAGVAVNDLDTMRTSKGEWLVVRQSVKGRALAEVLEAILPEVLTGLPLKRRMRWGSGEASFLRPVRWLVVRCGQEVVPVQAFGLSTGGESRGHRFHHPAALTLDAPTDYTMALREAYVIADPAARRANIVKQVQALAHSLEAEPAAGEALYDEITGLVEWPVAIAARFDAHYLDLPGAVLTTTLAHHQRFIPLRDKAGGLTTGFIAVTNLDSREPDKLRGGLERVIRPRLEDAEFYYRRDRERRLADYAPGLESLAFGAKLGSMAEKGERLGRLAGALAEALGGDAAAAARAGRLAKCDLVTGMVFEFPELQGLMGSYYAAADGENKAVADAIAEQYLPAGARDALPDTPAGAALAMADRLDTLVGGFASGRQPTGTKDAFGLRRAAFGLLRIAAAHAPGLDLAHWLAHAAEGYPEALKTAEALPELEAFLSDRLHSLLRDANHAPDVVQAVLAVVQLKPAEALARAKAVSAFRKSPEAEALASANKRIANILRKAGELPPKTGVCDDTATEETALADALRKVRKQLDGALASGDFDAALLALAGLREPVDAFFDEVLVMASNPDIRARRLHLLSELRATFLEVADIGELHGTGVK